jgi:uncharacterized protein (TIGR00290 family)
VAENVLFTWSSGKDSALALYELNQNPQYKVAALLTTVTEDYQRISMHGVREILLDMQTKSLGLPVEKIYITKSATNEDYEANMKRTLARYQRQGVSEVVFGDIFLEDLRQYREQNLATVGMKAIFPLWKKNTTELSRRFIRLGFKAVITCIDSQVLDKRFVGRYYDEDFLSELPPAVDPCGENGEFHSFVFDGPLFREKVSVKTGDIVLRDNRFYFCDVIPQDGDDA